MQWIIVKTCLMGKLFTVLRKQIQTRCRLRKNNRTTFVLNAEVKVTARCLKLIWIINLFNKSTIFLFFLSTSPFKIRSLSMFLKDVENYFHRRLTTETPYDINERRSRKERKEKQFCFAWSKSKTNLNCKTGQKEIFLRHKGMQQQTSYERRNKVNCLQ